MKVVCLTENLKKYFNAAERILGKNQTLPILSNFLLATDKKMLKISATNLEIGLEGWINCKIEKEGSVSVPGRLLTNLINNLPEEKVVLEEKNTSLLIQSKNYKSTLNGLDPSEFPLIPKIENSQNIKLEAEALRNGILDVINAASIIDSRVEINTIFLKIKKNEVRIVATDSFRLAEKKLTIKPPPEQLVEASLLIPLRTAYELTKILEARSAVKIHFNKNQALFETEDIELFSRLVEGSFPDYEQIIPQKYTTQLSINRNDFVNTVKVTSLFSSKINDVKLHIDPDQKEIEMISSQSDRGEAATKLEASIEGERQDIIFNYHYLLDGLANIKSNEVIFELSGEASPAVLRPTSSDGYFYLIMPIKNF